MPIARHYLEARALTKGPKFHYFGYYDKFPYDITGKYCLTLETDFMDRPPQPADVARIGMVEVEGDGTFQPLAETRAFNWQQGTHLQWMPQAADREILYNVWEGNSYLACVHNIQSGEKRLLPRPVYALSRDGRQAVSVNFSRIHTTRPGYGYNGIPDPGLHINCPDNDGIWVMDMETGQTDFIISIAQAAAIEPEESMQDTRHWFNHLEFSTDDSRFVWLHRWHIRGKNGLVTWKTRMLTANPDGSDIYLLNKDDMTSHFDWKNGNQIIGWARQFDIGDRYFVFTDQTRDIDIIGEDVFSSDGHCSYSPDRKWILTDTYPQAPGHKRTLILYNIERNERIDIGRFYAPEHFETQIRCDLHPRWSRDGRKICFDSMHENEHRQLYEVDVTEIVSQ